MLSDGNASFGGETNLQGAKKSSSGVYLHKIAARISNHKLPSSAGGVVRLDALEKAMACPNQAVTYQKPIFFWNHRSEMKLCSCRLCEWGGRIVMQGNPSPENEDVRSRG